MSEFPAHPATRLPVKTAYYLRHLLRGRFSLVPSTVVPPKASGRVLQFTREQLREVPDSPRFIEALAGANGRTLTGRLWPADDRQPVLVLDGLGGWTLRLPRYGRSFQTLRELRVPADLVPTRFAARNKNGIVKHRHSIRLRWHPHALLFLEVTAYPSGRVAYEAWVGLPRRQRVVPLLWPEAQRVIELFRDMAASYFRVVPEGAASPDRQADSRAPAPSTD